MKNKFKFIFYIFGGLIIFLGALFVFLDHERYEGSEYPVKSPLRLPVDMWPGNFWILIADKKGFFSDEGLDPQLIDVSADYYGWMDELDKGNIDSMCVSIFDLVSRNENGSDLVGVLYTDFSKGAEGLLAKEPYKSIKDLAGRRIGVESGTYLEFFLEIAMGNANMPDNSYDKIYYSSNSLKDAYINGEVDAIILWDPDLSVAQQKAGGNIVFSTGDIPGMSPGIFVFKKDFLNKRQNDVYRLLKVWQKTTSFILNNPDEAVKIISSHQFADGQKYTEKDISDLMKSDILVTLKDNFRAFTFQAGFDSLYGNAQYAAKFLQERNKNNKFIDTNLMLDNTFIHKL